MFGEPSERSEWCPIVKDVAQERFATRGLEIVIVVKPSEGTADHTVAKMSRALARRDSAREFLPDAEGTGAPGNLIAETQEPCGPATDGALAGGRRGPNVRVDATSEIEAPRRRGSDQKREFYPSHGSCCNLASHPPA